MTEMFGGPPDFRDLSVTRPEHHRRNSRPNSLWLPSSPRPASRPPGSVPGPPRAGRNRWPAWCPCRQLPRTWSTGSAASTPPVGSPTGPKPPTHSRPPTRYSRRSPAW